MTRPSPPSAVTQWAYPEAGSGDADAIWSARVSDGFGGIWKEIDETPDWIRWDVHISRSPSSQTTDEPTDRLRRGCVLSGL